MAKVFRLYTGGSNTIEGWGGSSVFPYNSANRNTIQDPDGARATCQITSIPSPFARIDLVKAAFSEVCKSGDLDGKTIYHRMVSDSLDVGEIFFNIDKFAGQIEVIPCNVNDMINRLETDGNHAHKCVGDALEKYLNADKETYNFGSINNIYLLNYIGKERPGAINIVGATSPATLFFCLANDLSYVTKHVCFMDNDKPFDMYFKPLYGRDFKYVKTWFILRKKIKDFSTLCPGVNEYLDLTYKHLTDKKKSEIDSIDVDTNSFADYETINVSFQGTSNEVDVLGEQILKRKNNVLYSGTSNFTIEPEKPINKKDALPLVLPVDSGGIYSDLIYTTGQWGRENKAPYKDEIDDYMQRRLPYDGSKNPYITISDLLEDTLISVNSSWNTEKYFSGNIDGDKISYLIPLKPLFFKFFSVEYLVNGTINEKKIIEMKSLINGTIKVILRIPIKGRGNIKYIEYSRKYYKNNVVNIGEKNNNGGIKEFSFSGLIMPIVRFNNPSDAYYTVACVSGKSKNYELTFFDGWNPLSSINKNCRKPVSDHSMFKSINYTIEKANFDYIQIKDNQGFCGLIIPKFNEQRNDVKFSFAVDLGTSNIHIEYKTSEKMKSKPFDYELSDAIPCMFYNNASQQEQQLIEKDFLPNKVGEGDFHFPTRTVLSCSKTIDWTDQQEPYILYNLPLTYDKRIDLSYNKIISDIKWGSNDDEMEACVKCIMLMLRNKVLLNDGDITNTKVTWFYPISIPQRRLSKLKQTWEECYNKFFHSNDSLSSMTESEAPILYYFKQYNTAVNLINVDMGGGTTDVAFAEKGKVTFVTSFKFATNVLFEDSYSETNTSNGIVDYYRKQYEDLLRNKDGVGELVTLAKSETNILPANMASFMFSLKDNALIKEVGIDTKSIDFNYLLQNDENFKIVFIIYYVAVIYHIAHIIKMKNITEPRHISFSGNGSKIVTVLTSDNSLLSKFTEIIFEQVLGKSYNSKLDILGLSKNTNPKEATCKGGILGKSSEINDNSMIILKGDNKDFINKGECYKDITEDYKKEVIQSVKDFFDFVLSTLNKKFNFKNNFGITSESLKIAKNICSTNDLLTWLNRGIEERSENDGENEIEETAFFYPIKGVLNELSRVIYENLNNNNK